MEAIPRRILKYVALNGKTVFDAWLGSLKDIKGMAKIRAAIDRLEEGNLGNCKSVGDGVIECVVNFGPGYRVYFGQQGAVFIILLCGGDKRTQDKDIQKAKEYWADFKRRFKNES